MKTKKFIFQGALAMALLASSSISYSQGDERLANLKLFNVICSPQGDQLKRHSNATESDLKEARDVRKKVQKLLKYPEEVLIELLSDPSTVGTWDVLDLCVEVFAIEDELIGTDLCIDDSSGKEINPLNAIRLCHLHADGN